MIEFDSYVPSTWLDSEGVYLIAAPQEKNKPKAKRARAFRFVAAAAAAFAVGMASTNLPTSLAQYAVGDTVVIPGPVVDAGAMPDDVGPGYWPKLVTLVRTGRKLSPDDTSFDPLPLA